MHILYIPIFLHFNEEFPFDQVDKRETMIMYPDFPSISVKEGIYREDSEYVLRIRRDQH